MPSGTGPETFVASTTTGLWKYGCGRDTVKSLTRLGATLRLCDSGVPKTYSSSLALRPVAYIRKPTQRPCAERSVNRRQ